MSMQVKNVSQHSRINPHRPDSMPTTGKVSNAPTGSQATSTGHQIEEMEHKSERQQKFGVHYPKGD